LHKALKTPAIPAGWREVLRAGGEEEKFSDFFEKAVDKTGDVGYNNKALFKCKK